MGVQLVAAQLVDGDVGPGAIVGRRGEMGQVGALPRQVVMVQHGGPPGADLGHQGGGRRVEGERAEVLDDDEVGRCQRVGELAPGRRRGGVHGQALEVGVDRAGAGHRDDPPPEAAQRGGPLGRFDRHAVAPPSRNETSAAVGTRRTVGRPLAGEGTALVG